MIHILLHFLVPACVAVLLKQYYDADRSWWVYFFMLTVSMVVDMDHLLADPIYDPTRCSIGFHPLHSLWAILFYLILLVPVKTRIFAIGVMIHMGLDLVDCIT